MALLLGLPFTQSPTCFGACILPGRQHINWDEQPLGLVPDKELADRLGVSVYTVRRQRHKAGILHLDMSLEEKIKDALSGSVSLSAAEIADMFGKQTDWVQKKLTAMMKAGLLWRHKAGRGYVYTLRGVAYKKLSAINGTAPLSMKARPDEAGPLVGHMCDDPVVDVGSVSLAGLDEHDRSDHYFCHRKRQHMTLRQCIELFGEMHAVRNTRSHCWKCKHGASNRLRHCYGLEPSKQHIDDLIAVASGYSGNIAAENRLLRAADEKS